jgi:hypothetical protein
MSGLLCSLWPQAGKGQGFPVIDSAAIAEAADNLKAVTQQVQELNSMLTQVQGMVQTVGQAGLPTLLFQQTLSQSGISQFGPPVDDLLSSVQSTWSGVQAATAAGQQAAGSFQNVLSQLNQLKGQLNSLGTAPDFSTFTSAQAWVKNELTVADSASATTVALTRQARSMLAGEAAANAYAMALNARQQVSTSAAARSQTLAAQATSANNLRGDMAANTSVMLAMHDEMAQIQALMAAVLEVQSAARLAEGNPSAGSPAANGSQSSGSQNAAAGP